MAGKAVEAELSDRARHLLKVLVERYIRDGQPVGSRTLSRDSGLDLSPATIRNVMADLEEMGLVAAPHTSAGRVPTPKGIRLFVDALIKVQTLSDAEVRRLQAEMDALAQRRRRHPRLGLGAAVGTDAHGGRGDGAAPQPLGAAPDRVPAALGQADPGDPGDRRERGAEPHPPHGSRLRRGRTQDRGQLPQRAVRRAVAGAGARES
jgi:hypothetical protein